MNEATTLNLTATVVGLPLFPLLSPPPPHSLPMCAPRSLAMAAVTLPVDRRKLGAAGGNFGDCISLLYFTFVNEMKTIIIIILRLDAQKIELYA